jgi:acetylornithine deacetylase/succinyl-diaminopimelate desuccinylase-like protein
MKNGLAAILEMVRAIKTLDGNFPGELLVTVYGRHEAPLGDSAGLSNLIRNGVKGDAALVTEGPEDTAWIMAKGAAVWQVELTRKGDSSHELRSALNWEDFLGPGLEIADTLRQESARLRNQAHDYPLLGPESLFVGQMHTGDFYNRLANQFSFEGTRRWHPDKMFNQAEQEFKGIFEKRPTPDKLKIATCCNFVGESYEISPNEPVVGALQRGYRSVMGDGLPIDGTALVTDACRLVNDGSVPTILWGFGSFGAHADYEYVELDRMYQACRICLAALLEYIHHNE